MKGCPTAKSASAESTPQLDPLQAAWQWDSSRGPSLAAGLLRVDFGGSCPDGIAFLAVNTHEFWLSLFSPLLLGPQLLLTLILTFLLETCI